MLDQVNFLFLCMVSLGCNKNQVRQIEESNIIAKVDVQVIDKIKNTKYKYISPDTRIGDIFENRKMCSKIEWINNVDDQYGDTILYRCHLTDYHNLFDIYIKEIKKEDPLANFELFKIPSEIKQDILFDVSKETPAPVNCEFAYRLKTGKEIVVSHPYCFRFGYDSEYTESWNDIVYSIISRQVNF